MVSGSGSRYNRRHSQIEEQCVDMRLIIKINNINDRFNLNDNEGCITEIFGGPMLSMLGLGFMYTNKNTITIGLGITLSDLIEKGLKPYEVLDKLKQHPTIAPLIKDGTLEEYSAHLIPEGGYKKVPRLYDNGIMVVGDAAMLVNNMHWEGTNLAMVSGKLAGETALEAINKDDYSKNTLKQYKQKLDKSFVMKDLKTYKDLMTIAGKKSDSFMGYYLKSINAFFEMFTTVDSIPKKEKYHEFIKKFFKDRKISGILDDFYNGIKLIWSILKWG